MRGALDGRLLAAVGMVSLLSMSAMAAEPVAPAPRAKDIAPAPVQEPSAVDQIKQPVDWFKWGADLRLRHEYLENVNTLNNEYPNDISSYQRYRGRLWGSIMPMDNLSLNARITQEMRYWYEPQAQINANDGHFHTSYAILDQANVTIKDLAVEKSTLTVGRQDVILLDGWLVLEGTPLDGSRTIFFDAVRYQMPLKDLNSSIDVALLAAHASPDKWVTAFGPSETAYGRDVYLSEQDEVGGYINYGWKPSDTFKLDAYFIAKNDDAEAPANWSDGTIYTLGARVENKFNENLLGRVEGAYQFAEDYQQAYTPTSGDLSAYGATAKLAYMFNDSMKNEVALVGEYLSGNDPDTGENEAFVPLWARYPQWSEIFAYNFANETRPGEITNIIRLGPSWSISPTKKLSFTANYFALWADENTKFNNIGGQPYYGDDLFRGHFFQGILRYKFNRFVAAHLWAEYFMPGEFYSDNRNDDAIFLRAEINLTF